MVFIEYLDAGIVFLIGFGRVMQYLSKFLKKCYGTQCSFIAFSLNLSRYDQYPSDSWNEWKPGYVFINRSLSPFSLEEKERKNVLWHICANLNLPPKFTLTLILIRFKRCKSPKKCCFHILKFKNPSAK
jgi:hypothetical protein